MKQTNKKTKLYPILCLFFFIECISGIFCMQVHAKTKSDTTKPKIKVTYETDSVVADSLKITVKATDNVGVVEFRYAAGARNTAYFRDQKKGNKAKLINNTRTFNVKNNITYTFYAVDAAGNTRIKQITINTIDKEAPVIQIGTPQIDGYTRKKQYFTVQASDDLSGVNTMKYAYGIRDASYFEKNGVMIPLDEEGKGKAVIKKNSTFTFYAVDQVGHAVTYVTDVSFMDVTAPTCNVNYSVLRQTASVELQMEDDLSGIAGAWYMPGIIEETGFSSWMEAEMIPFDGKFGIHEAGEYTIRVQDLAGNVTLIPLSINLEFRAAWITYIEFAPSFAYTAYTYEEFKERVDTMFDQCWEENLNAVIVQIRPFGDAFYPSAYFPWSGYITGEQGLDPGFDPLEYMVDAAHIRGLEFHAYLNPYRIEKESNYDKLSDDNPAKAWLEDDNPSNDRNVLLYNGQYYYNPAKEDVRRLIVNGVKEIVQNYEVDGIHFDDYFYPSMGSSYKKSFDYKEYNEYKNAMKDAGLEYLKIEDWRRNNVSTLVKEVYQAVKSADPTVVFGISPAGNINNLRANDRYYVDIDLWLSSEGYLDYICPQIYWGFENTVCPFAETTDQWISLITNPNIHLYVGLPLYVAGTDTTSEWKENDDVIARQVIYLRETGFADGFFLYRQEFLNAKRSKKEMDNLRYILQ